MLQCTSASPDGGKWKTIEDDTIHLEDTRADGVAAWEDYVRIVPRPPFTVRLAANCRTSTLSNGFFKDDQPV